MMICLKQHAQSHLLDDHGHMLEKSSHADEKHQVELTLHSVPRKTFRKFQEELKVHYGATVALCPWALLVHCPSNAAMIGVLAARTRVSLGFNSCQVRPHGRSV